jgi:hypothetical protein
VCLPVRLCVCLQSVCVCMSVSAPMYIAVCMRVSVSVPLSLFFSLSFSMYAYHEAVKCHGVSVAWMQHHKVHEDDPRPAQGKHGRDDQRRQRHAHQRKYLCLHRRQQRLCHTQKRVSE